MEKMIKLSSNVESEKKLLQAIFSCISSGGTEVGRELLEDPKMVRSFPNFFINKKDFAVDKDGVISSWDGLLSIEVADQAEIVNLWILFANSYQSPDEVRFKNGLLTLWWD
jgi:hypothetical protein